MPRSVTRTAAVLPALAAPGGSARGERRRRAPARRLGARYEAAGSSGHLVVRDRPDAVARAVLGAGTGPA